LGNCVGDSPVTWQIHVLEKMKLGISSTCSRIEQHSPVQPTLLWEFRRSMVRRSDIFLLGDWPLFILSIPNSRTWQAQRFLDVRERLQIKLLTPTFDAKQHRRNCALVAACQALVVVLVSRYKFDFSSSASRLCGFLERLNH
jgi:hypothetical protein